MGGVVRIGNRQAEGREKGVMQPLPRRPPVPAVVLRLAKRAKKNWDLLEIPFV